MDIEVLCEGLGCPEGPIAMADSSVILVEVQGAGRLYRRRWPRPGLRLNFNA